MKKFRLDLSKYEVTTQVPVTKVDDNGTEIRSLEDVTEIYPLRDNISTWLRGMGIFKSAEDVAEAVMLAKEIRECEEDTFVMDDRAADVLKKALNRLIELTADGKANLGGPIHEEAICRVVGMKEIK